jgi:hypothetical protein
MHKKFEVKDITFLIVGFLTGVAVTLLVLQLQGNGTMLKGSFSIAPAITTSTSTKTVTTDSALSDSLQRLSSGERINSAKDDPAGLVIHDTPTTMEILR